MRLIGSDWPISHGGKDTVMMDEREQEAIIQGVQDIVALHTANDQDVFEHFRNDSAFRYRVAAFISRCGIDVCYCWTGGNRCHQCFVHGIIARILTTFNPLCLEDFLILLLRTHEPFRKLVLRYMERSMKYFLTNRPSAGICSRIDLGACEKILKAIRCDTTNDNSRFSSMLERFRNDQGWRDRVIEGMLRWGMRASPCRTLGHPRRACFLGNIPARLIACPDPIRRDELLLVLFHLNASFRKRIAEFMIRDGSDSCFCWNNGHGCNYAFVRLGTFVYI